MKIVLLLSLLFVGTLSLIGVWPECKTSNNCPSNQECREGLCMLPEPHHYRRAFQKDIEECRRDSDCGQDGVCWNGLCANMEGSPK